jgi:3-oxoacyl-[acyl-carrier protein] reductase
MEKIKQFWIEATIASWDMWNYQDIDKMINEIKNKYPHIDILINNAWELWPYDNLVNIDIEKCNKTLQTNLLWPIYLSQKVIKLLQNKKWHILFTSSIHWNSNKGWEEKCIPYCLSKAWIDNLVWIWARDLAPNIRINAIAPWVTKTPIWDEDSKETIDMMLNKSLIKKWITPEQIADWFLFLIENKAITWEILYISWGFKP